MTRYQSPTQLRRRPFLTPPRRAPTLTGLAQGAAAPIGHVLQEVGTSDESLATGPRALPALAPMALVLFARNTLGWCVTGCEGVEVEARSLSPRTQLPVPLPLGADISQVYTSLHKSVNPVMKPSASTGRKGLVLSWRALAEFSSLRQALLRSTKRRS